MCKPIMYKVSLKEISLRKTILTVKVLLTIAAMQPPKLTRQMRMESGGEALLLCPFVSYIPLNASYVMETLIVTCISLHEPSPPPRAGTASPRYVNRELGVEFRQVSKVRLVPVLASPRALDEAEAREEAR